MEPRLAMASNALDRGPLVARIKTLINTQLKAVLKRDGLPVSGAKAALQDRLITQVDNYIRRGDIVGFNRFSGLVSNPDAPERGLGPPSLSTPVSQPSYMLPTGRPPPSLGSGISSGTYSHVRPNFKDSPFYLIDTPLTPVMEIKVSEATRDQIDCKVTLTADFAERMSRDSNLKIMIYCAGEPVSPFSRVEITFPTQIEIKINGDDVKANFKGLKNKPGSTRPVDITNLIRKKPSYENIMSVTYALTNKKFYMVVNLVRQSPPEVLAAKLENGKCISKNAVIEEMRSKAQDSDLVATSSIMSLKCPLSTLRIDTPCRSTVCTHNQCFDVLSFLQLQEQAPTWTCPVCNKIVNFEALQIDQYVNDILKQVPKSVDQVTIEPDGTWSQVFPSDKMTGRAQSDSEDNDDEDLIEIHELSRSTAIKGSNATSSAAARTPPLYPPREPSTGSLVQRSGSIVKRPNQVIDLTFDSDEEGEPSRPPKRQMTQPISNGHLSSYAISSAELDLPQQNRMSFSLPKPSSVRPSTTSDYGYGQP